LFKQQLTLFVYPLKNPASGRVENLDDLVLDGPLQHLFAYLRAQQSILPLEGAASRYLDIQSPDVLAKIRSGGEWLSSVPESVATAITQRSLFGYSRG
jgi:hypothetical protein